MDFFSLGLFLGCYCRKTAFWAILGPKNGILGSYGLHTFILLCENDTNVLVWKPFWADIAKKIEFCLFWGRFGDRPVSTPNFEEKKKSK